MSDLMSSPAPDVEEDRSEPGLLHSLTIGAFRDFVWADLRDGIIRVADLPRSSRMLVRFGLVLMVGAVGLLLAGDFLREVSPLLSTPGGAAGRGTQLPAALFPVTLVLLSLAWAFMLVGALRTHWTIRTGVLAVWAAMALHWVDAAGIARTTALLVMVGGVVAVGVVFHVVRSMAEPMPAIEFAVFVVLVGTAFLLPHTRAIDSFAATGTPFHVTSLSFLVTNLEGLALPLLLVIGLDIAEFLQRASGWVVDVTEQRLPSVALTAALAIVAAWRLWSVGADVVGQVRAEPLGDLALGYVGAVGVVLIPLVAWWLIGSPGHGDERRDVDDLWEGTEQRTSVLAVGYIIGSVLVTVATLVVLGVSGTLSFSMVALRVRLAGVVTSLGIISDYVSLVRVGLFVLVLGAAWLLARRGRRGPALYLAAVGGIGLWYLTAAEGAVLGVLAWDDFAYVNHLWTLVALGLVALWVARRQLHRARQRAALLVLLITALLAPAEVAADPFSPFFAFAGMAFVAFGIAWDLITSGSWANEGSPRLPRTSRVFLYVGYVLFTVTIINWAVATHDLTSLNRLTGDAAAQGFAVFGKPLLFMSFVLLLTGGVTTRRRAGADSS